MVWQTSLSTDCVFHFQVQYKRNDKFQEIFGSFTSIAVWAAVRFVHKTTATNMNNKNLINSDNNSGHYYAFLPLITDPGDEARNRYLSIHEIFHLLLQLFCSQAVLPFGQI